MYTLNTESAKKADTIGAFITETGKYVGVFTRAEKLVSQTKGTHGIGFSFRSDDGKMARFDIWTIKASKEPLPGLNQINALMACLKTRQLTESAGKVLKWDETANKETLQDAPVFAELMGKPVGLLLRSEEYEKMQTGAPTGETSWRMGLFACFQAGTELMASEILDRKTKPEQLGKVIALLCDKPLKKKTANSSGASRQQYSMPDNFADDDIPF